MARAKTSTTPARDVPGMQAAGSVAAVWKPIEWVKRWAENPRINHHVVAGVAKSIQEFGFGAPLICRSDGTLIAGDTRIQAAHKLGLKTVPVRVMDHLSDDEAAALALADNRLAERAKWSEPGLGAVLQRLSADLRLATGFSARESLRLVGMLEEQQRAPADLKDDVAPSATDELRRKWKTKLGDLWTIGGSRLLCGDSTSAADLARLMNGEKAVLLNTDPPYGIGYADTGQITVRGGKLKRDPAMHGDIENDDLQGEKLQAFLEEAFAAALPHLAPNAAWYVWHPQMRESAFFGRALDTVGVVLHRHIVWVKPRMHLTRSGMYHWRHEGAYFGWVRGNQPPWLGDKKQTSVWEIGRDGDAVMHPTQKPLELFQRPIANHTKPGELCLELFSGSGSQVLAAEITGRRCAAMELDPKYVAVLLERASSRGIPCAKVG
jgi:DNA modification methylase